jgi:hypothetical protein
MKPMYRGTITLAVAGLLSACGSPRPAPDPKRELPSAVAAVLANPSRFELLSLDASTQKTPPADAFHRYKVLGRTVLDDAGPRQEVVASLVQGMKESEGRRAICFEPRHGIRAQAGDTTVDLVICFACRAIEVYLNDKQLETVATTPTPEATLDRILSEAKIPLHPKG